VNARAGVFPLHGWAGVALVLVFWALNWFLPGLRTQWGFFPLWAGYGLAVDGLVWMRKGSSLLTRSRLAFAGLFLLSIPGWWLFELINWRTQNWSYLGAEWFTPLEYFALTSLCFSTVMPAVFGTAELASTFGWIGRLPAALPIPPRRSIQVAFFAAGWIMLALLLLWPSAFFPFVWISVFFILEPMNAWLGRRSLVEPLSKGDWRPVIALWTGGLICGFFWEMWNYYSYPKWIYHVPFANSGHIFEMPVLGYGGYLPFALELYALYHLLAGFAGDRGLQSYIQVSSSPAGRAEVNLPATPG
jgi:hypothetical protein